MVHTHTVTATRDHLCVFVLSGKTKSFNLGLWDGTHTVTATRDYLCVYVFGGKKTAFNLGAEYFKYFKYQGLHVSR